MSKTTCFSSNNVGLGIMSGTSLDGLDMALCCFEDGNSFELQHFESIPYSASWQKKLQQAPNLSGLDLKLLENEYSRFVAKEANRIIQKALKKVDFIACHGHTIFHQPEVGLTYQMINGNILAAETGITTVCDFRSLDVALHGNGAPLVPIGDRHLFQNYDACLNLGGIANVSYENNGKRLAYDIGPANMALNHLAMRMGHAYDKGGKLAASGTIDQSLIAKMDDLDYYKLNPPKSLGREWFEQKFMPLLIDGDVHDLLATATFHIANQIAQALNGSRIKGKVLVTGGGSHNTHLLTLIQQNTEMEIQIPSRDSIDSKEAVVFAYLGMLRIKSMPNVLASVTGAVRDNCSGAVFLGNVK